MGYPVILWILPSLVTHLAPVQARIEAGYPVILWILPSITSRTTEVIGGIIILRTSKQPKQLKRPTHTTTRNGNLSVPITPEGCFKHNRKRLEEGTWAFLSPSKAVSRTIEYGWREHLHRATRDKGFEATAIKLHPDEETSQGETLTRLGGRCWVSFSETGLNAQINMGLRIRTRIPTGNI